MSEDARSTLRALIRAQDDDRAWGRTVASHQPSFNTLMAVLVELNTRRLLGAAPDLLEVSLGDWRATLKLVVFAAAQSGASAYVSGAFPLKAPDFVVLVGFPDLWKALEAVELTGGDEALAFRSACRHLPGIEPIARRQARAGVKSLTAILPTTAPFRRPLGALYRRCFLTGVKAEFLYRRLMPLEYENAEALMRWSQLAEQMFGSNDELLGKLLGPPAASLPWPLERQCRCGAPLSASIYCCDPDMGIPAAELDDLLHPDHVLVRACCGKEFRGFRCDRCGQLYTWKKGIVDSVTDDGAAADEDPAWPSPPAMVRRFPAPGELKPRDANSLLVTRDVLFLARLVTICRDGDRVVGYVPGPPPSPPRDPRDRPAIEPDEADRPTVNPTPVAYLVRRADGSLCSAVTPEPHEVPDDWRVVEEYSPTVVRRALADHLFATRRALVQGRALGQTIVCHGVVVQRAGRRRRRAWRRFGKRLRWPLDARSDPIVHAFGALTFEPAAPGADVSCRDDELLCPLDGPVVPLELQVSTPAESHGSEGDRCSTRLVCPHCLADLDEPTWALS